VYPAHKPPLSEGVLDRLELLGYRCCHQDTHQAVKSLGQNQRASLTIESELELEIELRIRTGDDLEDRAI
jgi:hypothetical protein